MLTKKPKKTASLLTAILWLTIMLTLTSCGTVWDWLWSRDAEPVDTNDLIVGDRGESEETDEVFEGAVEYTGEAHSGTDIYYVGKEGSPNRSRIIVIDAGHQLNGSSELEPNGPGSEVMKAEVSWGAEGVYTGQAEYELTLRVALLLRDELIRRGYSVVMIRETNNVSISNMARAQIANKYRAAAYIRIHANSWTDNTMNGAMTICQSISNPYPDCSAHYKKSYKLSRLILNKFCEQTGIGKLEMREMDDMTGTNWSQVPTTIVEMGFLSNTSDDRLMATEYFRQEAAIGIANGLDEYFEWLEEQETEIETTQKNDQTETPSSIETSVGEMADVTTEIVTEASVNEPASDTEPEAQTEIGSADEEASEPLDTPALEADPPINGDVTYDGAVEYTGEAHNGTEIYYVGAQDSPNHQHIIVIDAGHQLVGSSELEPNGPDSEEMKAQVTWGATGMFTGQTEYELNLQVALLLRDELISRGYSVVMIRETNEVSISNMERAQIANKYDAAAYIRIHANSWTDEAMDGAMTICQSANNPYPTCSAHYEESYLLSTLVLDGFCTETGMHDLSVREMDNMTGTNWSRVPTTIVEMGFLSNEADDTLMLTEEFRQNAAVGIANGLDAYIKQAT